MSSKYVTGEIAKVRDPHVQAYTMIIKQAFVSGSRTDVPHDEAWDWQQTKHLRVTPNQLERIAAILEEEEA